MSTRRFAPFLTIALFVIGMKVWAQQPTGAIGGRVVDSTQAVVPGAEVSAHNLETGLTRNGISNEEGLFRFPALPAGRYDLTVNMQGFKKVVISNIKLDVGSIVDQTVVLEIGQVTEQVTVEANINTVNTISPDLGAVVGEQMVRELPLNGRNFVQLAGIQSGVVPDTHGRSTAGGINRRSGIAVAISGSRPSSTAFIFDGIPFKEHFYGAPGTLQPIDSIQEFKVQKGFFTGRYDSAGVINLVTKSGTNRVHGTIWEFFRNDNFDARKFFDVGKLPEFRQHQYGFETGGPAIRNKLFWFASYEAVRFFRIGQGFATVPSLAWRNGDLSSVKTPVMDPLTGQPFPNNQIPSTRFAPFTKQFLDEGFIPPPTPGRENLAFNYTGQAPTVQDDDKWVWRGDYVKSDKDKFFGRAIYSKSSLVARSPLKGLDDDTPLRGTNVVLNWTHVFTPRLLVDGRVGLNRSWMALALLPSRDTDPIWSQQFKINNINTSTLCNFPPSSDIAGIGRFGGRGDCIRPIDNDYYYMADLNYTRGKHQMAFGFTVVDKFIQQLAASWTQGAFSFTGAITGDGMADFLLGHPESAIGAAPGAPNRVSLWWDVYFEDQYRVSRNFSLTASLRYQLHPWFSVAGSTPADRTIHVFDPVRPGGGVTFGEKVIDTDRNDWAPRLGFAWTPFGKDDFVIRSSFGIFYDETPGNQMGWDAIGPERGSFSSAGSTDPRNPVVIQGLFAPAVPFTLTGFNEALDKGTPIGLLPTMFSSRRRQPYLQSWTLSIQKALPKQMLGEVAYVGQHGLKLSKRVEPNRPLPSATDTRPLDQRRPWRNIVIVLMDDGIAQSHYNALQLSLRRTTANFSFIAGYTYSKDTAWDDYGPWKNYALFDPGNSRTNWDVPHRFSFSWNYEMPHLAGQNALVRHGLGGWQFGGITSIESGTPFGIGMSADRSNTGTVFTKYPNRLRDGSLPGDQRTPDRWFDTSAFELPPLNTYGNAGANILDADGLINQDIAFIKNFALRSLGEGARVQFRAELFNAFNHPNFRGPSSNVQASTFGRVSSTLDARIIQFALKLHF